jgi:Tfp pilus assembly protein PilF
MRQALLRYLHFMVFAALAAGCASLAPPPASDNTAVLALVDSARADAEAGRHANAAATLERALRIEPKNARLWQGLARVKLTQGDYAQAESLATRSNSWAVGDSRLRAENWELIAETRARRGDDKGAREALERAGAAGP